MLHKLRLRLRFLRCKGPDDRTVDFALGMALLSYGQVQKAETIVDRMLKTATPAEVNLLLGAAQLAAGDAKTAVSTLHTASDANGDFTWSLVALCKT